MKIRNVIISALLAATTLLTGCQKGDDNMGKPQGIEGFMGNMVDVAPKAGDLIATFEIEGHGTIKAVLFPEIAPTGVDNFKKLADQGFYKGLTIHRVVKDFMFQGGSTNGNGTGGEAAVNGGSFGIETNDKARHFYGALCYANAAGQNSTQFYIVNNNQKNPFDSTIQEYTDWISELKNRAASAQSEDEKAYYLYMAAQYEAARDQYAKEVAAMDSAVKEQYNKRGGTPSLDGDYTVFGQVYEGFDVIDSISAVEVVDNGSEEKSKPVQTITITDVTVTKFGE